MVARVQKTAQGYSVPLTAELMEQWHLSENSPVELLPVDDTRYASMEEALAAFERTLPQHENSYRALAK